MSKSAYQSSKSALQSSKSTLQNSNISAPMHDLQTISNLVYHSRNTHEWAHNLLKVRLECTSLTQTQEMHRKEITFTHGLPLFSRTPKGVPLANHMELQPILNPYYTKVSPYHLGLPNLFTSNYFYFTRCNFSPFASSTLANAHWL